MGSSMRAQTQFRQTRGIRRAIDNSQRKGRIVWPDYEIRTDCQRNVVDFAHCSYSNRQRIQSRQVNPPPDYLQVLPQRTRDAEDRVLLEPLEIPR
jgi:hypothetical protein